MESHCIYFFYQEHSLVSHFWLLFRFLHRLIVHFCVPPELCWKSRLGRVGGVECQRCVSFVFIVLTGAQWCDCAAIWNPTPSQSFRGVRGGGDVCAFSQTNHAFWKTQKPKSNPSSIPSKPFCSAGSLAYQICSFRVLVKCSHFPNINDAFFPLSSPSSSFFPSLCCFVICLIILRCHSRSGLPLETPSAWWTRP